MGYRYETKIGTPLSPISIKPFTRHIAGSVASQRQRYSRDSPQAISAAVGMIVAAPLRPRDNPVYRVHGFARHQMDSASSTNSKKLNIISSIRKIVPHVGPLSPLIPGIVR